MHRRFAHGSARIRTILSAFLTAILVTALIAPAATFAGATPPVAGTDDITVLEDSGTTTTHLMANDSDADPGDTLSVVNFGNWSASWGTYTLDTSANPTNGDFAYTPAANYCKTSGTNNTYYFLEDSSSNQVLGFIHISVTCVNDQPTFSLASSTVTVDEDSGAYGLGASFMTAMSKGGGSDESTQTLTVHISNDNNSLFSAQPAISGAGTLTFTPAANAHGTATVTVYLTDSGSNVAPNDNTSPEATFDIVVDAVPDAPVAVDDSASMNEDPVTAPTIDVLANDTDGDNDVLTVDAVTQGAHGTVAIAGDAGSVTYMPDANWCGTGIDSDTFTYDVTDGGLTDTGTVTVAVSCLNDLPTAVDDTVGTGAEDQPGLIEIDPADLLANDSDVETAHDALTIDAWGDTSVGGVVGFNAGTGLFEFELAADFCGTASFDYELADGDGGTAVAVNSMDVTCVNDAPIADDQSVNADENTDEAITLTATDVDSDTFTFTVTVDPAHGTVDCTNEACTYTPETGYHGPDSFSFSANDGALDSVVDGVVTIDVAQDAVGPVAVAPAAAFGTGRVDETAPLRLSWSATDAATGVTSYELQVKVGTGAWTAAYTGSATAVTKFYPFGRALLWRVRATDGEGNVGNWATAVAARTIMSYQGAAPVTYSGYWGTYPSAGSSGTGYKYTLTYGRSATLRFTGLSVLYVAPKTAGSGYAKVYIDGMGYRFNLRSATATLGQIIARKTWSSSGIHTIKVVNDQGGRQTNLDAFIVLK